MATSSRKRPYSTADLRSRGACASGKWCFHTRRDAKESARKFTNLGNNRTWPYFCPDCNFWHTTHSPRRNG